MDLKLVYNYLKSGIYLFLFRYLFLKYHIFNESQLNDIYNEGWKKFLTKNVNLDTKKVKLPKKLESKITKFKFIEFYSNFEILNIQLFDNQAKANNKFNKDNKENICTCLGRLKSFANIDIVKFINLYNGKKRSNSDLSFKILFGDNNKNTDFKAKRKSLFGTEIKTRNRLSMTNKSNNIDFEKENSNKNYEEEKDEEIEEDITKVKKRNVKKKIKINQTDIKKAKKKMKYRKKIVVEDEREEIEE